MKKILLILFSVVSYSHYSQTKEVKYQDGAQVLKGQFAKSKKARKDNAAVLILPAWMGVSEHTKEVATKLSNLGYHAFVADIYGEGNNPTNTKEAGERAGFYKSNAEAYRIRISLGLQELIKQGANPENIVVIGYCFGGTGALEAARAEMAVKGVVSFHGGLGKIANTNAEKITAKVLVLHGADDPYVPQTDIESFQNEMRNAKADWQMIYYADAVHAFTEKAAGNDKSRGAAYNATADRRSFEHFLVFLKELFGA